MSKYYKAEDVVNCVADVLAEEANMRGYKPLHAIYFKEGAKGVLEDLPTIDIVHCKDCKHRKVYELDTGDIFRLGRSAHFDDWFCADGERIDNDILDKMEMRKAQNRNKV